MPRIPKKISYIKGVKHWDCFMCKKILPESAYGKTSNPLSSPHASYCRKCNAERSKLYIRKPKPSRKRYKPDVSRETTAQILSVLQGFDPSWTMSKLKIAMTETITNKGKGK